MADETPTAPAEPVAAPPAPVEEPAAAPPDDAWIALVGINTPDLATGSGELRFDAGQPVPAEIVRRARWLVDQGAVGKAKVG